MDFASAVVSYMSTANFATVKHHSSSPRYTSINLNLSLVVCVSGLLWSMLENL